jgi:hypothetical protein
MPVAASGVIPSTVNLGHVCCKLRVLLLFFEQKFPSWIA